MTYPRTDEGRARNRQYQADWYERNRAKKIEQAKARQERYEQRFREYKATLSCMKCGENHPATLHFHHRDPAQKVLEIAYMVQRGYSEDRLWAEVAKCDVLCANCHLKEHYNQRRANGEMVDTYALEAYA